MSKKPIIIDSNWVFKWCFRAYVIFLITFICYQLILNHNIDWLYTSLSLNLVLLILLTAEKTKNN